MLREIGHTGVKVYPIGLGAMPLSISGRPSEENALEVIKASLDNGVTFIDTANVYCLDDNDIGHNEKLIAKALKKLSPSENIIVATKGGLIRPDGRWETKGTPTFLKQSAEKSLQSLGVEQIFLYQLHAPDSDVPFAESVEALKELKDEGKIKHVGLSNVSVEQLKEAIEIVDIQSVQNRCGAFCQRDLKNGLVRFCEDNNITYIPYSPVGGGSRHQNFMTHEVLKNLSNKYETSPYCVVLAWLLGHGEKIIPIPGASKIHSATDSPKAIQISLTKDDMELMNKLD